jgi:hypothetical protein
MKVFTCTRCRARTYSAALRPRLVSCRECDAPLEHGGRHWFLAVASPASANRRDSTGQSAHQVAARRLDEARLELRRAGESFCSADREVPELAAYPRMLAAEARVLSCEDRLARVDGAEA